MKRDILEIARWSALTGIVVFGALAADRAWSGPQGQRVGPGVRVGDLEYRLEDASDAKASTVSGTVTVTNHGSSPAKIAVEIASVDRTFNGSLTSRTIGPNDFKEAVVAKTDSRLEVGPSGSKVARFRLQYHERANDAQRSPAIIVTVGGKRVMIGDVRSRPVPR